MRLFIIKNLLITLLLSFGSRYILMAQARFNATISPTSIGKNETAELRLMVENAQQVEEIIPPILKDFIIISGPNQESGMQNNNGVTKQYIGYTYLLKPKRKGNFTIGSATAKADGKILKSNGISVEVTNESAPDNQSNNSPFSGMSLFDEPPVAQADNREYVLKKGENIQAKIDKNIFIKVDIDKTSCFVGQPIVVTYKLFTRLQSESNITKNPSFNGFSVIDLSQPGSTAYGIEKIRGKEYNVYTLRKAQLYPLQAGQMEVEIAEVENTIHFIKEDFLKKNASDLSGWSLNGLPPEAMLIQKVTIQSKPILINIKALPDVNKPVAFKGAVGKFILNAGLEKNSFTTDDAGKLHLTITGQGNMELINAPDINWPAGIETFDPTIAEALNKHAVPVSGTKSFDYPFTVTKAGIYTIPSIEYCYFDAALKIYKNISTEPMVITVTNGIGKPADKNNSSITKSDSGYLFSAFYSNRLWLFTLLAILIIIGIFLFIKKEKEKKIEARLLELDKQFHAATIEMEAMTFNPLVASEDKLIQKDSKGFYNALNNELRQFLATQLKVPVDTINKKSIAEELDKKGISVKLSLQVQQLLNDIEWQLYAPFTNEDKMDSMYQSATIILHAFSSKKTT